ncbi:hypothetical protein ACC732_15670 [Rhizobium ruizarguesonis]
MSVGEAWAKAIAFSASEDGGPTLETVITHIRDAVFEMSFVSRGRITTGLKEAYRPLGLGEDLLRERIEAALDLLLLSGDVDEFTTSAGRGYAGTPPRLVYWGGKTKTLLGTSLFETGIVRHLSIDSIGNETAAQISLSEELGRPEWRNALVELGGVDVPDGDARHLFSFAQTLTASGERYSLDEPTAVAILSGRGDFFGRTDPSPSGRWRRIEAEGCFPASILTGYSHREVMLNISGRDATLWQPPSRDIWRWIIVGQTLTLGDPVLHYDPTTETLEFLTPPPRQAERAALITGTQKTPWSWNLEPNAYEEIEALMGSPRKQLSASPRRAL